MLNTFLHTTKKPELHIHFRGCLTSNLFLEMLLERKANEGKDFKVLSVLPEHIQALLLSSKKHAAFIKQFSALESSAPLHTPLDTSKNELQKLCHNLWTYKNHHSFFLTYLLTMSLGNTATNYFPLARSLAHYFKTQNISYADVIFSVGEYLSMGMSIAEMKKLLSYIQKQAKAVSCEVNFVFDFVRNFGEAVSIQRLEMLLSHNIPGFTAITLGGDERHYPAKQFQELFKIAKKAGLFLSCHAGEFSDHHSIQDAIELLNVDRIGHGTNAIHSDKVMDLLKDRSITLEVCLTSNHLTHAWKHTPSHPVRTFFARGIPVSLASDDPGLFSTSLGKEISIAHNVLNFSIHDIKEMIHTGFRSAFRPQHTSP